MVKEAKCALQPLERRVMSGLVENKVEVLKAIVDMSAISITVATVAQWIPAVAAVLTILWTATRLYEAIYGTQFSESGFSKWIKRRT